MDDGKLISFGGPWVALCCAFALHVLDEALTGFLDVYNPTVAALRQRWAWNSRSIMILRPREHGSISCSGTPWLSKKMHPPGIPVIFLA